MPEWVWSSVVLTDVARALRQWHDATCQFDLVDAVWGFDAREPGEVICHNDFAPYNCVFRGGRFAGAIDFDLCSPGPRLWDIAYTAYRYAADSVPVGYSHATVFAMVIQRLGAIAAWTTSHVARTGNTALEKHAQMYLAHAQWIDNELRGVADSKH
jgi:aminoglycoside phosphotransferase (APT) family kinase protein